MIVRITLRNYMSHAETVLEPAAGMTVVLGPNNCGKSAVVSALDTLCNRPVGDFMVRHGAKEAEVTVETLDPDGARHSFTWRRRKGGASYEIDGKPFSRVGHGPPEELHKLLRLGPVAAPGGDFLIHFGEQKAPVFLLNESEARQAAFFSSSSDAESLIEIQRRHREKVQRSRADHKRLTEELAALDRRLGALAPLDGPDGPAAQTAALEARHAELEAESAEVEGLSRLVGAMDAATARRERFARRAEALTKLSGVTPPDTEAVRAAGELVGRLSAAERRAAEAAGRSAALSPLQSPPEVADPVPLRESAGRLAELTRKRDRLAERAARLASLRPPEPLADEVPIAEATGDLEQASAEADRRARESADAANRLAVARFELDGFLRLHPTCPLCGGTVDAETLAGHAAHS
jgi:exonuclease SbcC